jgi:hypothetical protein
MSNFSLETRLRIYDDRFPDHYLEICPDADTGDNVEIRSCQHNEVTNNYDIVQRIAVDPSAVPLLIQALEKVSQSLTKVH